MKESREVNGILLLNKPAGITSNKVLQQIKRIYQAKKAGHTGSLDPLATGMLPICFGRATKLAGKLLDSNKCYQVTAQLGFETDTLDIDGVITKQSSIDLAQVKNLPAILEKFKGPQTQIPPMYSALKHKGQRLYDLARAGITIERAPRNITIFKIELLELTDNTFKLEVVCTKGTYIRTLIADIGQLLGCYATVSQLHRVYVEPFEQAELMDFAMIEGSRDLGFLDNLLQPYIS